MDNNKTIALRVVEAPKRDVGLHMARIDQKDMDRIGLKSGDILLIQGKQKALARVQPSLITEGSRSLIRMDGVLRENAGVGLDDTVRVERTNPANAERVTLRSLQSDPASKVNDSGYIRSLIQGSSFIQDIPVLVGNQIRIRFLGSGFRLYKLIDAVPENAGLITPRTKVEILPAERESGQKRKTGITYEDIGGLQEEIKRIREMIELPLKHPQVFERLGIDPPKGVLLHGPPGTGKTLIAKAVSNEADIHFISVNGPEIVNKFYGESEAQLRNLFDEAEKKAPSILFIDEIDAIAPKRTEVTGEVEKRIVAQLLASMDGLKARGKVTVIGATNIPNVIDTALRRPGRFDREIATRIPDKRARLEILQIHTRGMPLSDAVNLEYLAEITHGYVGADLEALCREAALLRLRDLLESVDLTGDAISAELLENLSVSIEDFKNALKVVEPSAIRELFVEVPEVAWEDIGGLDEIKTRLQQIVEWPLLYGELYNELGYRPPRGILLTGASGTGKTLLAKALATETQRNFVTIKGPELISKWVGESEKGVREVFRKARLTAPSILFFDEIDALTPRRGSGGGDARVTERVISQFLTEMDGIEVMGDVLILGATNRLDLLDPAILRPGRFDMVLELNVPDLPARKTILTIHNRKRRLGRNVDLDELAHLTKGFVGSDIAWICDRALGLAIEEYIHKDISTATKPPFNLEISKEHYIRSLEEYEVRRQAN
ncbi:CDC48 family AAA ATPase [Thermodesulfobacteriota bacterium]